MAPKDITKTISKKLLGKKKTITVDMTNEETIVFVIDFHPNLLATVAEQIFVTGQLLDQMAAQLHSLVIYRVGENLSQRGFHRQSAWAGELGLRATYQPEQQSQDAQRHHSFTYSR